MANIDIRFENEGAVMLVQPLTERARQWIQDNTSTEPWQWLGRNLGVEPRYALAIAEGAIAAGLKCA